MEYPINLPNLKYDQLKLVTPRIYGKPKIYLNDNEIEKRNNRYLINTNEEKPILITLKNNYLDPIPKVFINDHQIHVAKAIKWYEYIWTGLPILMVFQGGLLGALFGLISLRINLNIFRSDKNTLVKYLLTLVVSVIFVLIFLIIAAVLNTLINK